MFSKMGSLVKNNFPEILVFFFLVIMPWIIYFLAVSVSNGAFSILILQNIVCLVASTIWLGTKRGWDF